MNEPNGGQFKSFRMLALPFSKTAMLLGMTAWIIFYFANAVLAWMFQSADSAPDAVAHFAVNAKSFVFTLTLARHGVDSVLLFTIQCALALLLWSTFGLAIARSVALTQARDEYIGYFAALGFGWKHCKTALLFPVIIAALIGLFVLLNGVIGAVMQIPYVSILGYLLLPLAYLLSAGVLVLGLTAAYGLGLVSGAIAVERRGTMDAWGKALNYISAQPIQFLIYLVIAKVFVIDIVYHYGIEEQLLHRWTNSSLVPFVHTAEFAKIQERASSLTGFAWFKSSLYWAIGAGIKTMIFGLVISLAVGAFTSMFLILRREIDGIDVTDIDLVENEDVERLPEPVANAAAAGTEGAGPASFDA